MQPYRSETKAPRTDRGFGGPPGRPATGDGEVLRCAFGDQAAWASAASTDSSRAWILCFLV
jgi:hypothetical protein